MTRPRRTPDAALARELAELRERLAYTEDLAEGLRRQVNDYRHALIERDGTLERIRAVLGDAPNDNAAETEETDHVQR
jgi:hypothetical protein